MFMGLHGGDNEGRSVELRRATGRVHPVPPIAEGTCCRSEAIGVKYQSLVEPKPRWRWIAQHAIGFDGLAWIWTHVCVHLKISESSS